LRIGCHTSISGGLAGAAQEATRLGCNTFQIFSSSPRMWRASVPKPDDVKALKTLREKHDLFPLVVHDSYLINLGAIPGEIREKSIAAFRSEIQRCLLIGAEFLVAHPGNGKDQEVNQAIVHIAQGIIEASAGLDTRGLTLCLEGTAGQGANLGRTFEELAMIRHLVTQHSDLAVGFCLDTCHLLAAGYDIASEAGLQETLQRAQELLGLDRVHVIHANDSKNPLGSRLDRHEHIGEGFIGTDAFKRILHDPRLRDKPFLLETPLDEEGDDVRNLTALRTLAQ
jgi:deoxyribonuclease IV